MPKILYQFQSRMDSVEFNGAGITAEKLKLLIATKIGTADQLDLRVNGTTVVGPGQVLIPGTTVTVLLVAQVGFAPRPKFSGPLPTGETIGIAGTAPLPSSVTYRSGQNLMAPGMGGAGGLRLADAPLSEAERVERLMKDVGHATAPAIGPMGGYRGARPDRGGMRGGMRGGFSGAQQGPPPPGYVCDLCGKGGHWINHCSVGGGRGGRGAGPMDGKRLLPPVGISAASLEIVDDPDNCTDGKFRTANGKVARRKVNTGDFRTIVQGDVVHGDLPATVRCFLCLSLVTDAVTLKCCPGHVHCSECLDGRLMENGFKCPHCDCCVQCEDIRPDETTRRRVTEFLCKAGTSGPADAQPTATADNKEEDCW